jgi:hypothetical protein
MESRMDGSMKCPDCGRNVAGGRDRCLYCGAAVGKGPTPPHRVAGAGEEISVNQPEAGADSTVEENTYVNLDDLPASLRKKVEEALREREKDDERPPVASARDLNLPPGFKSTEDYIEQQLNLLRSERRPPLNKLLLTLILFASIVLGGVVVWLLS